MARIKTGIRTKLMFLILATILFQLPAQAGMPFGIHPGKWADGRNYLKLQEDTSNENIPIIRFQEFNRQKFFRGSFEITFEVSMPEKNTFSPDEITLIFLPIGQKHQYDPHIFVDPYSINVPISGKPIKKGEKYIIGWFRQFTPRTPILPFTSTFHVRAILPDGSITKPSKNYTISINETDQCYNHALKLGTPLYKLDHFKGTQLRQHLYKTCKQLGISVLTTALIRKCQINQTLEKYRLQWLYSYPECKK